MRRDLPKSRQFCSSEVHNDRHLSTCPSKSITQIHNTSEGMLKIPPQKTQNGGPTLPQLRVNVSCLLRLLYSSHSRRSMVLIYCWANAVDDGPALRKCKFNIFTVMLNAP